MPVSISEIKLTIIRMVIYQIHEKLNIEKSLHCQNNRRVFSLNITTTLEERHMTNKNRIPCTGPTMQASGWDWGHVRGKWTA